MGLPNILNSNSLDMNKSDIQREIVQSGQLKKTVEMIITHSVIICKINNKKQPVVIL